MKPCTTLCPVSLDAPQNNKQQFPISIGLMTSRFDVVIYGASGFTGQYIIENLVRSPYYTDVKFAVAGRSESKIRQSLDRVSEKTGKDLNDVSVIIADSGNFESLVNMAKQSKVIINAVGPYSLYGEPVVKAAVENGASHVDISGEEVWIEKMHQAYDDLAAKMGVYVVSACGWDSIPADLGVNFLKTNFNGDLNHVETIVEGKSGPEGYPLNQGTYQTIILGMHTALKDFRKNRKREIMMGKIVKGRVKPKRRLGVWRIHEEGLDGVAVPFAGSDKSIIERSQYYDATVRKVKPVHIETYFRLPSFFTALLLGIWLAFVAILAQFRVTLRILQNHPDACSFNFFKKSGPSEKQIRETSFICWLFGYGYQDVKRFDEQHEGIPDRKVVATCKGPDPAYMSTSGCVLSAALVLIKDGGSLPEKGGVYTTSSAFGQSKIYEYLNSFGISFQIESETNISLQ